MAARPDLGGGAEIKPMSTDFVPCLSVAPSAERGQGNSVVMTWQTDIVPVRNVIMAWLAHIVPVRVAMTRLAHIVPRRNVAMA